MSNNSPDQIKQFIKKQLGKKVKNVENIKVGDLAVTVVFKDGTEIQLLPALCHGEGCKIPERNTNRWSNVIYPKKFANKLTEVNQKNNNTVVPVIKIVKSINAQLPPDQTTIGLPYRIIGNKNLQNRILKTPENSKSYVRIFFRKSEG